MNKLTDLEIRNLKLPGKHFDGGGLYLELTRPGHGYWRLKYRFGGKEKRLAFGVYPDVPLKLARERRAEARAVLARGEDPAVARQVQQAEQRRVEALTFELVAREWIEHQGEKWADRTRGAILASLETEAFPKLGARPIAQLKPLEVKAIVKAVDDRGAGEAASRLLQRIKAVFRYAVVHERIESNPMVDLRQADLLKPRQLQHRAAMSEQALPGFLAALAAYQGAQSTVTALQLLMLTVVRPGELRGARWQEFDLAAALWRVPAERMKMKAPHTVPLARQAVVLLQAMPGDREGPELLFPSPFYPGKPMSENTLNSALARMGFKGEHTAHGFRALFSTIANERGHDADAIERQLAHVERNQVRAAYHRATYLDQRRALMQWWADWLDTLAARPQGRSQKAQRSR
jgi:integrase